MKWLRVVLPVKWFVYFVAAGLTAYVFPVLGYGYFLWKAGAGWTPEILAEAADMWGKLVCMVAYGGALAYGIYRAVFFSPFMRHSYGEWLRATPYDGRQPLPLGPLHLVPQDLVPVLTAEVLAVWLGNQPLGAATAIALASYAAGLVAHFYTADLGGSALLAICGIALVFRLAPHHPLELLAAAALTATLYPLIGKSLIEFATRAPEIEQRWELLNAEARTVLVDALGSNRRNRQGSQSRTPQEHDSQSVGWPLSALVPVPGRIGVSYSASLWMAAAVGWVFYCVVGVFAPEDRAVPAVDDFAGFVTILGSLLLLLLVFSRVALYGALNVFFPPISLMGRIATGRLFVPRFDRVYLAPVLSLVPPLSAFFSGVFARRPDVVGAIALASTAFILLAVGPSLTDWRMTGKHRMHPSGQARMQTRL